MRFIVLISALSVLSCRGEKTVPGSALAWPAGLPVYDHVVIVMEENKYYEQIVGDPNAPFINGVLVAQGANLTQMFGEEHNSEGNYFWLFSGSNQGVGFQDVIPDRKNSPGYPFLAGNLASQLLEKGRTFKGYAEDLPGIGSTVTRSGNYARKHVPWISFGNIPNGTSADSSCNLTFAQFPSDFTQLPTVAIVVPNLVNDMHDPPADIARSVRAGDVWLEMNIGAYYDWAKSHNSLLIVTFDENADSSGFVGLTNPASAKRDVKNRIPTIIAGAHVRHGAFDEGKGVTHVNLLRTLEAMYGLGPLGSQQEQAERYGISADSLIVDIFGP